MREEHGALAEKEQQLRELLKSYGRIVVAFSGGVDSTYLLAVIHEALGPDALAVSIAASFVPDRELDEARAFCASHGIAHVVRSVDVLADEAIAANPENRCYLCKKRIFGEIGAVAAEHCAAIVVDGTNASDVGDYRPGMVALRELGVASPLLECGFTKADIRAASRLRGLPTADKPSYACMATRFPYGTRITEEGLARIDAAEQYLIDQGFVQVRVRSHGDMARIEIAPEQFARMVNEDVRQNVVARLRKFGFSYISMDLQGYRTGSMNETLAEEA